MKRTILLSLLLTLVLTKANAYVEVAGFNGPTWYEDRASSYAGGSGTESDPYLIKTPQQLAKLAYEVNVNGASASCYKLNANIDLYKYIDNKRVSWIPIGISSTMPFNGTFTNPDGYTISNMVINANSTETTSSFGLFGYVTGSVEGIRLNTSSVKILINGEYSVGLLCGTLTDGFIRDCRVEDGQIAADVNVANNSVKVGGLIGTNDNTGTERSRIVSCVANTTIKLNGKGSGRALAGGVVGQNVGKLLDCHAIVNMSATGLPTSGNSYSNLGGIAGEVDKGPVKYCSASGDIQVAAKAYASTGGAFGALRQLVSGKSFDFHIKCCATSVTVSGGEILGGLIGHCYRMNDNMKLFLTNNVSSSYVDARDAANAGGIIGLLEYTKSGGNLWLCQAGESDAFCGTMTKPATRYYGTILGKTKYVPDTNFESMWGGTFYYSPMMCKMQTNGMGKTFGTANRGEVKEYSGKSPNNTEGYYGSYGFLNNSRNQALVDEESSDRVEMCFTDNYVLADLLFYITNDKKTLYSANDVTIDFTLEDYTNSITGERLATFTVPDNMTCAKVVDKHLYPLDPGEVIVTIKWNGLQRKVHLDITYGLDWKGNRNEAFEGGDGTLENPYLIHNADQLYSATHAETLNKSTNYFKLVNDIFFNTHLLKADGMPRTDAQNWYPTDFNAHLDGNGKTIYGLYVKNKSTAADQSFGLFSNLYGSVTNLAIVDSHVEVNAEHSGINVGMLCGKMMEGSSISNCLIHGNVLSDARRGGLCGNAEANSISITDIFSCVHVSWPNWPSEDDHPYYSGGIVCNVSENVMERCFSIGRVEDYSWCEGIADMNDLADCYFDAQMMDNPRIQSNLALTTRQILARNLYRGKDKWQQDEERYPMLSTFANTPYGKLLTVPILFEGTEDDNDFYNDHYNSDDRAGKVTYIFEFPTEDVSWSALKDQTYIDVINDCGAASIVKRTDDNVEILMAEAENVESQCTRARRTLPLNLRADLTHFRFKDEVAQEAAEAAFDNNNDKILTLRELVEATKEDFAEFNASAKANEKDLEAFPEFRYFTNTITIEEGMLSDLDKLSELQLPKKLTTIAANSFSGCSSLEEITVPATFTTMNEGALYESSIKNILVNPKHKTMESIDGALFKTDNIGKKHLVIYPPGRGEEDATISTLFHYIDNYAFYKVPALRKIYIDNCLPEGNLVEPESEEQPIVHENNGEMMDIYVNDGSYDKNGSKDLHVLFDQYVEDSYWGEYNKKGKLHIYYPLTVTDGGWATLYIGFPTLLPEGLTAYVVPKDINTLIDEGEDMVILNRLGRAIPITTPVVIHAEEPGLYKLLNYDGSLPDLNKYENKLIGSYIGQTEMGSRKWGVPVYQEDSQTGGSLTLGHNNNGEVGFFKYNGKEIPPYRAYLGYTNTIDQNANARFMLFIDDIPQGITTGEFLPQDKVQSGSWYTLEGVQLNGKPTSKGIYIYKGKKVVVK